MKNKERLGIELEWDEVPVGACMRFVLLGDSDCRYKKVSKDNYTFWYTPEQWKCYQESIKGRLVIVPPEEFLRGRP